VSRNRLVSREKTLRHLRHGRLTRGRMMDVYLAEDTKLDRSETDSLGLAQKAFIREELEVGIHGDDSHSFIGIQL